MMARLGFSIATDIQSDILILDEVLSVGDERFKQKSRQRMERLWGEDATILLVSHDLAFVEKSCQRAIWLDRGQITYSGTASDTVNHYLRSVQGD
jgi:ABC-type polysaccharide/polyol phosphate transport system ATPase subunit